MTPFRQALANKDFVLTAELPLHPAQSIANLGAEIDTLKPAVDAVQIGDNDRAEGHVAPLAVASLLLARDVEPIVHLGCRDRNRIALQSEILGAAAIGATTLLLQRGDKLPASFRGRVKGVFDTKATQLLATASRLRDMSPIESAGELYFGAQVTVFDPDEHWQAEGILEKIDAGAGFLQTGPCLNAELLARYVARLVALRVTHRAHVIVGVPLLASIADARSITEHYPDARIPESVIKRLADADDSRRESIIVLAEFLRVLKETPGVSGAAICYEQDAGAVVEAVEASRGNLTL